MQMNENLPYPTDFLHVQNPTKLSSVEHSHAHHVASYPCIAGASQKGWEVMGLGTRLVIVWVF